MAGIQQVSFTNPGYDYAADQAEVLRRQKLAELLDKQSMEPLQTNQMAGRFMIPMSPWQGLAKMGEGAAAGITAAQAQAKQKDLTARAQADAMRWYSQMPQATPGSVQDTTQEGTSSFDMSGAQGPANVAPKEVTPQERMAWILRGQTSNPLTAPIASQLLAQQLKGEDPFTLHEGDVRVGAGNRILAQNPKHQPPMVEHNFSVGENMVQPHISLDGGRTWQPVPGSQPSAKFAKQVAPTIINQPAPTMSEVVDPSDPTRMLKIDARVYKGGSLGSPGVVGVAGKEPIAAKREEKEGQGRELLKSEIDNLRTHFKTLLDKGAIPSDQEGGLSNASAWLRSSGAGQLGGRIFGTQEQTARNEIQSARLRLLNAIKNATGMSAQQLNSNAELKIWLDSMTNLSGSYESNVRILDDIEKAFGGAPKRRAGDAIPDEPPPGAVKPRG